MMIIGEVPCVRGKERNRSLAVLRLATGLLEVPLFASFPFRDTCTVWHNEQSGNNIKRIVQGLKIIFICCSGIINKLRIHADKY